MKTLADRIAFLVSQRGIFEKWVGAYDADSLIHWVDSELGDSGRLEEWVGGSKVVPLSPVLHVVSGNTPHAAFQSVFRAILVGCRSWVKVPSAGLPEFEEWAAGLDFLEVERTLPAAWKSPGVAVVFGGTETLEFFRSWLSPGTRITEHGPKLGAAFVFRNREGLATDLAEDILRYGQRGCVSVQMVYVAGDAVAFCGELAEALEIRRQKNPATRSEAGGIRNERELARFRIANGADLKMWESTASVDWTVVLDREDPSLRVGPSGGFVRVIPMPEDLSQEALGSECAFLSTAVVEPLTMDERLEKISPPRICGAGKAQDPGIRWHPDGEMPIAGLVRWRDLG